MEISAELFHLLVAIAGINTLLSLVSGVTGAGKMEILRIFFTCWVKK